MPLWQPPWTPFPQRNPYCLQPLSSMMTRTTINTNVDQLWRGLPGGGEQLLDLLWDPGERVRRRNTFWGSWYFWRFCPYWWFSIIMADLVMTMLVILCWTQWIILTFMLETEFFCLTIYYIAFRSIKNFIH